MIQPLPWRISVNMLWFCVTLYINFASTKCATHNILPHSNCLYVLAVLEDYSVMNKMAVGEHIWWKEFIFTCIHRLLCRDSASVWIQNKGKTTWKLLLISCPSFFLSSLSHPFSWLCNRIQLLSYSHIITFHPQGLTVFPGLTEKA